MPRRSPTRLADSCRTRRRAASPRARAAWTAARAVVASGPRGVRDDHGPVHGGEDEDHDGRGGDDPDEAPRAADRDDAGSRGGIVHDVERLGRASSRLPRCRPGLHSREELLRGRHPGRGLARSRFMLGTTPRRSGLRSASPRPRQQDSRGRAHREGVGLLLRAAHSGRLCSCSFIAPSSKVPPFAAVSVKVPFVESSASRGTAGVSESAIDLVGLAAERLCLRRMAPRCRRSARAQISSGQRVLV